MKLFKLVQGATAACLVVFLAACGGNFKTSYETPAAAKSWRVSSVEVTVPETLVVSEENTLLPRADIVWQEEPRGDRRAQVAAIMKTAITKGAAAAHGPVPVVLDVTMTRFHALTMAAERMAPQGVHDVEFDMTVRDARNGAVLFGPEHIEASFPAMTGSQMATARANGQTQKGQIIAHVAQTIAGWLGTGKDPRYTFNSLGG